MSAASIMIYLPDDGELRRYLGLFEGVGFRETDWCELTAEGSSVRITYGPCQPLPAGEEAMP